MKKGRNSKQIGKLIACLFVIMIIIIIILFVFLFNVDVNNDSLVSKNNETGSGYNYIDMDENRILTSEENYIASYDLISNSFNGEYQVILSEKKLYLNILDKNEFNKNFPNNELSLENEIEMGDYEVKQLNVGKIGDKDYLVIITDNGSVGIMDLEDAINSNSLLIEENLVSLDSGVIRLQNVSRHVEDDKENTIIAITSDGNSYDLMEFAK